MTVVTLIGTVKGLFVLRSNDRARWQIAGPHFKGWKVGTVARSGDGGWLAGTASDIYGASLHRSRDLAHWRQIEYPPAYDADSGRKLRQIWTIHRADDTLYAGVDEAGLFRSDDHGQTWSHIEGLARHPTRSSWFPGAGGLCLHAILVDPNDPQRIWVGISAVGVFRTANGGRTWTACNNNVPVVIEDKDHSEIGYCVHALAADPTNPDRIYRQDHRGMFRTDDGGDTWEPIQNGLPSSFGFPLCRDAASGALYCVPLESDEYRVPPAGRFAVYRSRDDGQRWEPLTSGLPAEHAYFGVLRGAMDVDHLDPCGVYLGTTSGDVFVSADGGEHFTPMTCRLPRVLCVQSFVE